MKTKHLYLALCVLGTALPYSQFLPFVREHGPDLGLMVSQLFSTRIGAFFGLDVIVSSLALVVFMRTEARRLTLRAGWGPLAALLLVGVSLALPLFLYLRETRLERAAAPGLDAGVRLG